MIRHPQTAATFNWFLAIRMRPEVTAQILDLARWLRGFHGLRGTLRPEEILHISLHGIGGGPLISNGLLCAVAEACERISLLAPPFEVKFGRTVSFGGPAKSRPLVLTQQKKDENADLVRFHLMLGTALRSCGLPIRTSFMPHVTLLYGDDAPELPVERISWRVEEFELIRSHIGATHYDSLGRWRLRGDDFPPAAPALVTPPTSFSGQMELGFDTTDTRRAA